MGFRMRNAEGGFDRAVMQRRARNMSARNSRPHVRLGFTLVELLVTITIIAILAAIFVGVSGSAIESGRRARTKSVIAKIHTLLMERWDSYSTRRVQIDPNLISNLRLNIENLNLSLRDEQRLFGVAMADMRLLALRELMRLEMPDRWSDIVLNQIGNTPLVEPNILSSNPSLRNTYFRRYESLQTTDVDTIERNQSAECLYMVVMLATGDGEARTLFSERDIGDTDGDGAPELLDGWGNPIRFIRWPAGFATTGQSSLMLANADADHDPFDPFRRDQLQTSASTFVPLSVYPNTYIQETIQAMRSRHELNEPIFAYRLVPLVYSAGPDGDPDLITTGDDPLVYDPYLDYTLDDPGADTEQPSLGGLSVSDDDGDNWIDNIHNHFQDNQ